ncbi:CHAP domain-containing protein [Campylobacter sputorum]|uniref:CHAP domain-containing protein n=1 Tax=Campylobacter sputorum TaxID=206 RepID=UPI00068B2F13|nr:CHAP domain-containing protein [Campylobacter sputorum]
MNTKKFIVFLVSLIFFVGCSTKTDVVQNDFYDIYNDENLTDIKEDFQSQLVLQDEKTEEFSIPNADKYPYDLIKLLDRYLDTKAGGDCSGFVSLINNRYDNLYFDENELNSYYSNHRKSQAMYNLYKYNEKISLKNPKVGDLIFFSNTSTKKSIKSVNPKNVTHVGIIRGINKDGTIKFIHFASGKNMYGYMNLRDKNTHIRDNKIINSYITRCSSASCLTSNRFIGYGKLN